MSFDDEFGGFLDRETMLAGGLPAKRGQHLAVPDREPHRSPGGAVAAGHGGFPHTRGRRGARTGVPRVLRPGLGSEPPLRPTIQELERYAPQWASLVPENPRVQAAVAHRLGEKYEFTYETAPNIRAVMSPCVPPCLYLSVKENDYESEGRRFEYCRARP